MAGAGAKSKKRETHEIDQRDASRDHSFALQTNTIDSFSAEPNGGLILLPPGPGDENRALINRLAVQHMLPMMVLIGEHAAEGGLMSYGPNNRDITRRTASYLDRILRGAKPAELPVQFPTKFELIVNLKNAKAIGIDVSTSLLLRADEVIE